MNSTTPQEFLRLANNFYMTKGITPNPELYALNSELINYYFAHLSDLKKKYKVALCCICVNPQYWQYILPMMDGAKQFFLPGHDTDFFVWSDLPEASNIDAFQKGLQATVDITLAVNNPERHPQLITEIQDSFRNLQARRGELQNVYPVEGIEWPHPTLLRYNLMLQAEDRLKDYDYIFYCDIDMAFVNIVGDEILGERLTAVLQPMYALRKEYWLPTEPNEKSTAYIKRPGKVVSDNGKPRFMPMYFAGGFQGGKSTAWLKAMRVMKKQIDTDLAKNYIAVWNDESHWNKYMFDNPDDRDIILTPSYTYPDSLIKEYFEPMWGQAYPPKLMTLTKKFSFQPGAGEHLQKTLAELKPLQK